MSDLDLAVTVSPSDRGRRLDDFVAEYAKISRANAIRLIQEGQVRVNRRKAPKGHFLTAGETVEFALPPQDAQKTPPVPQPELPLSVLYKDEKLIIANKPAGWPTHPLRPLEKGTLASALLARYPECASASEHAREGGFCHRLDRDTSGAIVAARDRASWLSMRRAFTEGFVEKEYWALCHGVPQAKSGEIKLALLPAPKNRARMLVAETPEQTYHPEALSAHTKFQVEKTRGEYTLLRVTTLTGRRHQIRAHLSYLGLPLYGDELYGGPSLTEEMKDALGPELVSEAQGHFLHAHRLRIPLLEDLGNEKEISVEAPLPAGRRKLLELLGLEAD